MQLKNRVIIMSALVLANILSQAQGQGYPPEKTFPEWRATTVAEHQSLAEGLQRAGLLMDAVEEYKQAAKLSPQSAILHRKLGQLFFQVFLSPEREQPSPGSSMDSSPNRSTALKVSARNEFLEAIKINPDDVEARVGLARIYNWDMNHNLAVATLTKALAIAPESAEAHYELAQALKNSGSPNYKRMEGEMRAACKYAPANGNYQYCLAQILQSDGRYDEAIAVYRQYKQGSCPPEEVGLKIVECLEASGNLEKAVEECRNVQKKHATYNSHSSNRELARLLGLSGRIDEAYQYYATYSSDASDAAAAFDFADALKAAGHWQEAISYYRKNLRSQEPEILSGPANLALLLKEHGNAVEAKKTASYLLQDFKKHADQHYAADDLYYSGIAYSLLGKNDLAKKQWTAGLNCKIGSDYFRGLCAKELGDYKVALRLLDLCKHTVDSDVESGIIEAKSGNNNKAIARFQTAIRRNPGNVPARQELAKALKSCGRTTEAQAEHKRAEEISKRPLKPPVIPKNSDAMTDADNNQSSLEKDQELANKALQSRNYDLSIQLYNKVLSQDAKHSYNHFQLAEAYFKKGSMTNGNIEREVGRRLKLHEPVGL